MTPMGKLATPEDAIDTLVNSELGLTAGGLDALYLHKGSAIPAILRISTKPYEEVSSPGEQPQEVWVVGPADYHPLGEWCYFKGRSAVGAKGAKPKPYNIVTLIKESGEGVMRVMRVDVDSADGRKHHFDIYHEKEGMPRGNYVNFDPNKYELRFNLESIAQGKGKA